MVVSVSVYQLYQKIEMIYVSKGFLDPNELIVSPCIYLLSLNITTFTNQCQLKFTYFTDEPENIGSSEEAVAAKLVSDAISEAQKILSETGPLASGEIKETELGAPMEERVQR